MQPEEEREVVPTPVTARQGQGSQAPARPQAKMRARERIAAERAARKRPGTPAAPGGDRGRHRRAAVWWHWSRQADLCPCPSATESAASSSSRAGHHRSGRRAHRGSPGQAITPLQTVRVRSAADRRRQAGHRLRQRGILPVLRGRTLVAGRRAVHFGTWSHLGSTTSSATDVYPNTATLSFRAAVYRSTELTLRTTELRTTPASRWTPGSSTPSTCPLRQQRRPVRGGPVPGHRQSLHPGGRAVQPAGTRGPVGGPDRQPARQPVEPGGPGHRRVSPGHRRGHQPGPGRPCRKWIRPVKGRIPALVSPACAGSAGRRDTR